jgi:hypothetical protein
MELTLDNWSHTLRATGLVVSSEWCGDMSEISGRNRAKTNPARPSDPLDYDRYNVDDFYRRMEAEQNLSLGIMGGLVAAVNGAVLWALVAAILHIESAAIALVIGFLVGQGVRIFGKGVTISFPIAGALLAILGCVLGKVLSACALYASKENVEVTSVFLNLLTRPFAALRVLKLMTGPLDALFYILAICEATKLSFRHAVFNQS